MSRRRLDDATLAGWFSFEPVAQTMGQTAETSAGGSVEESPVVRLLTRAAR